MKKTNIELAQNILCVRKDQMPAMYAFYKDDVGLTPTNDYNELWVGFDTGACKLAIHYWPHTPEKPVPHQQRVAIVLYIGNKEEVETFHKELVLNGKKAMDTWILNDSNEIGPLSYRNDFVQFPMLDPAGNTVHIENYR